VQAALDFLRDVVLNFISGFSTLTSGLDLSAAGAAVGGSAAQAGHLLAVFISPSVWPVLFASWGIMLGVYSATGLAAVITRRGKS